MGGITTTQRERLTLQNQGILQCGLVHEWISSPDVATHKSDLLRIQLGSVSFTCNVRLTFRVSSRHGMMIRTTILASNESDSDLMQLLKHWPHIRVTKLHAVCTHRSEPVYAREGEYKNRPSSMAHRKS